MSKTYEIFEDLNPPERLLMGPGPVDVYPSVLRALASPMLGQFDPKFTEYMDQVMVLFRQVFQTDNNWTFLINGTARAAIEACLVSMVEPGDKVLICINGVFGGRMAEVTRRAGAEVVTTEDDWGKPVDPDKVRKAFSENPDIKHMGIVHAETSTGVLSDAANLCQIAKENKAFIIMDTVTSLAGVPVQVDVWGADAVYSGSQKCLSCPPGLSPVTFSDAAVKHVENRKQPVQSWLLDLSLVSAYWNSDGARTYHHTAPVNSLMGLHEALRRIVEEGLETVWARHRDCQQRMVAGLLELGFEMLVDEEFRLPELLTVFLPPDIEDAPSRTLLLEDHGIEISAGLGQFAGKLWRIGMMGEAAQLENVDKLIEALKTISR